LFPFLEREIFSLFSTRNSPLLRSEIAVGGKKELKSDYNNYKLFGYDILLDQNMSPHLMEINARSLTLFSLRSLDI
jgi:hypothetical protein